jgi:hypothetical protein
MNTDNFNIPAFYFLKNSYGLSLEPYAASKRWWTPLIQKSFIDNFFRAGSYDYAVSTSEDTIYMFSPFSDPSPRKLLSTGIQLAWVDSKGKIWETSKGTSDQTNSFFTITKNVSTSFTFEPGYSDYAVSTLVTACFQCNLYDDAGNVIHLTNGRFRLELQFEQDYY